ncbi:MAG: DNA methyltransferase, partial [Candidatus Aminicenantes bacterium]
MMRRKYGEGIMIPFIASYFSRNIYGIEVMLPLYVIGFINLRKIIKNFCHEVRGKNWEPVANLYLGDTLDYRDIKDSDRTMKSIKVILCNPPYSRHSLNKGEVITQLVRDYYQVNNRRIKEKNLKGLQDDYVKFFRFAQWKIDQTGSGVMGFITGNSYLENPTFRGMRYSLLKSFHEIYILDLHGEARKIGKKDDDENIFGIGQGIAIGFFIKQKRSDRIRENTGSLHCRVFYSGMKGSKASKLNHLDELKSVNYKAVEWERVFPEEDFYLFTPVTHGEKVDIYRHFIKLTDIFPVHGVGIVTARDKLTIKKSAREVYETISTFSSEDEKTIKEIYKLRDDTRDWQVKEAKKDIIESGVDMNKIVPILYRPFDIRYTYYTGKTRGFLCMPRPGVMRHMLVERENIGLVTVRQVPGGVFSHCFAADTIIESRITSGQKGIAYIFP